MAAGEDLGARRGEACGGGLARGLGDGHCRSRAHRQRELAEEEEDLRERSQPSEGSTGGTELRRVCMCMCMWHVHVTCACACACACFMCMFHVECVCACACACAPAHADARACSMGACMFHGRVHAAVAARPPTLMQRAQCPGHMRPHAGSRCRRARMARSWLGAYGTFVARCAWHVRG